jgi:predicted component of type VI protein secretion system
MSLRENFISDAPDEEAGGKVNAISQNKTLYIGQFTNSVTEPELLQEASTIKDVFEKFKPQVDVEFQTETGEYVEEALSFNEMKDFEINNGSGQLVQNSSFLLQTKSNIEANAKIRKQIEQNKRLRDLLGNQQSKEELRNVLQNLLDELEQAK